MGRVSAPSSPGSREPLRTTSAPLDIRIDLQLLRNDPWPRPSLAHVLTYTSPHRRGNAPFRPSSRPSSPAASPANSAAPPVDDGPSSNVPASAGAQPPNARAPSPGARRSPLTPTTGRPGQWRRWAPPAASKTSGPGLRVHAPSCGASPEQAPNAARGSLPRRWNGGGGRPRNHVNAHNHATFRLPTVQPDAAFHSCASTSPRVRDDATLRVSLHLLMRTMPHMLNTS